MFDTDIGSDVDDALALGVLLAEAPALDLVAVTTVAGDTRLRARIAARLLGAAGRREIEVCAGDEVPLLRARERFVWFGHEGRGLPDAADALLSEEPAAQRIVRAAQEHPGLELVAVGPLTNVARALALDPKLPERIATLWVMGGHVRSVRLGDRELPPGIDYNLCSDPEATMAVLGAGFRTTLIPAEVTLRTWMAPADVAQLEAAPGVFARALGEMLRIWSGAQAKLFETWGGTAPSDFAAFLHDPLTALALVDASALHLETLRIVLTVQNGVLRTFEVAPGSHAGSDMTVATDVDPQAARHAILTRLIGL
ncbi:MAG: nucleoside hydrolase [Myxococcota bacterium]|nr:nucleoside hydrolase [Myxococcota bacterium]